MSWLDEHVLGLMTKLADEWHIPWSIKTEPDPETGWHYVHSCFGRCDWGYQNGERTMWTSDVKQLLDLDLFSIPEDQTAKLEEIYTQLQPLLEKQAEERRAYYEAHPLKFDRITIPKIKKMYPKLLDDKEE